MAISNNQKNYIKKNIHQLPFGQILKDTGLNEKEILSYLKKKWRKEKYQKFIEKLNCPTKNNNTTKDITSKNKLIFWGLLALVFAVYINGISNGFVSDDIGAITKNENIGNFNSMFGSIFGSLQAFIRFLTYHIFSLEPAPYRLFNIILHMGSTILVFSILSILYKRSIAIFAALLFAVHPLLTESITWISGMPYVLYGFLFLLSFYFYLIAQNNKKYYYFSLLSFFLACISSEKAIPLFLVFILYEWLFKNNKSFWKITAPFFMIALVLGMMFAGGFGQRITELETSSYRENSSQLSPVVQVPVAVSHYLKLLAWPSGLTLYHTEMTFSKGTYFLMTLILLAALAALFYSFKKNKQIFFWLAFFFIALSVTLAPLGVAWIVAERYAYLASLGIFVITAFGLDWLYEKSKFKGEIFKKAFYALLAIIIIALGIRTILRNNDWKNEDTLWIATAKTSPSGPNIHNNLGDVYGRQGDHQKSIEEFKKAIEINPRYADAYHNLANAYREIGQIDLAIENFNKAAEINPALWQSHQNLASIYFYQENYQKAKEEIEKALEANPEEKSLKQNLQILQQKLQE